MNPDMLEAIKALSPVLGLFGAALLVLSKILDRLIPDPTRKLLHKISLQTHDLHKAHLGDTARDDDGRLKWWFPQELGDTLEEILGVQRKILDQLHRLNEKWDIGDKIGEAQMIQARAVERFLTHKDPEGQKERP